MIPLLHHSIRSFDTVAGALARDGFSANRVQNKIAIDVGVRHKFRQQSAHFLRRYIAAAGPCPPLLTVCSMVTLSHPT